MKTEAQGIQQSDIIIRAAIMAAIKDMRANSYLLDYVFASLPDDELTAKEYGEAEVEKAKDWFLHQEIKVFLNVNVNSVTFPCISIALANSVEDDTTLGDVHYQPIENTDREWPTLAGPATPTSYDPVTGTVVFADGALDGLIVAPNMLLCDTAGNQYKIIEVPDYDGTFTIAPGTAVDLTNAVIRPQRPAFITEIESASYRETYSLGIHVDSEPVHATYLHSIVVFALLRYKQALLEGRGYERTSLSSSDLRRDEETLPENVYSRYIQVSGFVRQAWPKITKPKVTTTIVQPIPDSLSNVVPQETLEQAGDMDMLSFKLKP